MNDTTRSTGGELHLAKECSEYTGLAGSFCTITSSNVDAIPVGSKVVYASAAGEKVIESDLTIVTGEDEHVAGHVVLDVATDTGTVTLTGGTGAFAALHAETAVSFDGTEWHWDGTYSLTPAAAEASS
jgi:hypothetical protein